jgi:predicted nucleotidyltransferase
MFTNPQLEILALLLSHPDKNYYLSEIGKLIGKKPGVFQNSIKSLEKQNLLISFKKNNQRIFKINTDYPFYNEIKKIVQKTGGAEGLLKKIFTEIKGIKLAFIYGSYAKNKMRESSDIDVIIVGDPKTEDIFLEKIDIIEKKLQREINYKFYSQEEFKEKIKSKDPFLEEVLSDKYILLYGEINKF